VIDQLILIAWLSAGFYFSMLVGGFIVNVCKERDRRKPVDEDPLIIQITTVGNDTVDEIIRRIRSFGVDFPYEIWVVKEPYDPRTYMGADRVITVPSDFTVKAKYKARALEYARCLRLNDKQLQDYRVLFLDDDSIPSKEFLIDCWTKEFDVLEGIIAPRNNFGSFKGYLETIRTVSCLQHCALFQGLSAPIWVHGEAMCITSEVDRTVSWDYDLVSSEDLVYGQMAVSKGFSMRFTYSKIYITSPLTFRDYFKQRRRWTWGNIHAIRHLIPFVAKVRLISFWALGLIVYPLSVSGMLLDRIGVVHVNFLSITLPTLVVWFLSWTISAYYVRGQLRDALVGVLIAFPSVTLNWVVSCLSILHGPQKRFEVIKKVV
jgi:cellulose synthase/poly-beta-1,6-N-acetylglucosamine synthase-like glycosyltransferase